VKELSVDHSSHTLLQAGSQTAISDRMRELLARAAQDHVYEQRTQGAVLDEIRQRLEGMEWLLREVRERELGGLSGAVESVAGRLEDMTARPPAWAEVLAQHVESLREHVDEVRGRTQDVADQMAAFGQRLGQVHAGMEAAAGRFTRLDKAVTEAIQRVERQEAAVLGRLDAVDERLEAASERGGGLPAELEVGELRAAVAEMGAEVSATASSLAPLFDAIRNRPDRDEIAETVSEATSRVVEPVHGDVARRLAALEETMLALAEALLRPVRSSGD
jgi:phage shock protein A